MLVSYLLRTTAVEVQTRHLRTILSFRGREVEVSLMQPFRRVPSFWPWTLKRIAKNSRRGPASVASFSVHFLKSPPTVPLLAVPRPFHQNAQVAFHTPFTLHSYHWIVNRQQSPDYRPYGHRGCCPFIHPAPLSQVGSTTLMTLKK